MSDLIDKQVVLDTIHLFFTEEIDKIPTKKTEDGEVLIMCKAQPLFAMNKAICKRIKALPSVSPTQNCVGNALDMRCDDAISRDAVWDVMQELWGTSGELIDRLMALPSVNPQPCEDAISRQAVLDEINSIGVKGFETYNDYSQLYDFVDTLSSVNPQEPKADVLDKIRTEIDAHRETLKIMADDDWYAGKIRGYDCAIEIIDKYKAESEGNSDNQ